MCCRLAPIARAGNGKVGKTSYQRGNQHGFITGKNSLTERDHIASVVLHTNVGTCGLTIRLAGKWLLDIAVVVTVQATILKAGQYR